MALQRGEGNVVDQVRARQAFDWLLQEAKSGRLTRRQVLGRAAAVGMSASMLGTLAAAVEGAPAAYAAQGGSPKPGGTLKVGLQADPTALDFQKQSLTAIGHAVENIYNTLVRVKPDLTVEPELAESWQISPDGKTYTFKLRQGVTFHDGTPATSADVKYSFERLVDPKTASPGASDLASMAKIEAPDPATVVMTLKQPDASLLATLTGQTCFILSKAFMEKHNGNTSQAAMGTGPFVFKEYVPNTKITLEKNKNYWDKGKPYVDGIEMIPISEDTQRMTAVTTGTVDFIEYAPLQLIEQLKADPSLMLTGHDNTNIRYLGVNLTRKPFDNLKVRQAIAAVLDRDAIIGAAVFGQGTSTEVLFPKSYWAALDKPVSKPDVAKAKQLLKEAGYPDGFSTSILSWSAYSFLSNAAVVIQQQLKQIGIKADLDLQENATYIANYFGKKFDLTMTGTSQYVDPNQVFFSNFVTGQNSNAVSYSNPAFDKLVADGIATTDQSKRREIYQQAQQLLLNDLPWINIYIANQYEAMKTYVKGYVHIPTGANTAFRDVWLEK